MSLTGPSYGKNISLTVQFNTEVSDNAYNNARDGVLLTRGVTKTGEDRKTRTMTVEVDFNNTKLQSTLEELPGVESVTRQQQNFGGRHRL